MAEELKVTLEFSGGAELLFDKVRKHDVLLPAGIDWNIQKLILWIKDNLLKERPELFVQGKTVRPGILVLVNDADWELMVPTHFIKTNFIRIELYRNKQNGELEYKLQKNDCITFISTLHGG